MKQMEAYGLAFAEWMNAQRRRAKGRPSTLGVGGDETVHNLDLEATKDELQDLEARYLNYRYDLGVVPIAKHMGPGPHPSGTPQSVHGDGNGAPVNDSRFQRASVRNVPGQTKLNVGEAGKRMSAFDYLAKMGGLDRRTMEYREKYPDDAEYEYAREVYGHWQGWKGCRDIRQSAMEQVNDVEATTEIVDPHQYRFSPGLSVAADPEPYAFYTLDQVHNGYPMQDDIYRAIQLSEDETEDFFNIVQEGKDFDAPLLSFATEHKRGSNEFLGPKFGEDVLMVVQRGAKAWYAPDADFAPMYSEVDEDGFLGLLDEVFVEQASEAESDPDLAGNLPYYKEMRQAIRDYRADRTADKFEVLASVAEDYGIPAKRAGVEVDESEDPDTYWEISDYPEENPHEIISGGRFHVVSVRDDPEGNYGKIVTVQQIGTFDPFTGNLVEKGLIPVLNVKSFNEPLVPKSESVKKHYGPGPHKSGTPQSVHGGNRFHGGGQSQSSPLPSFDESSLYSPDDLRDRDYGTGVSEEDFKTIKFYPTGGVSLAEGDLPTTPESRALVLNSSGPESWWGSYGGCEAIRHAASEMTTREAWPGMYGATLDSAPVDVGFSDDLDTGVSVEVNSDQIAYAYLKSMQVQDSGDDIYGVTPIVTKRTLWRGVDFEKGEKEVEDFYRRGLTLNPGDTVEWGLASTSPNKTTARSFTGVSTKMGYHEPKIMLEIDPGAKALNTSDPNFEVITGGRFEVLNRYGTQEGDDLHLVLRQVGVFDPDTGEITKRATWKIDRWLKGPVKRPKKVTKHYGPGPHKSGSPQSIHGGSGQSPPVPLPPSFLSVAHPSPAKGFTERFNALPGPTQRLVQALRDSGTTDAARLLWDSEIGPSDMAFELATDDPYWEDHEPSRETMKQAAAFITDESQRKLREFGFGEKLTVYRGGGAPRPGEATNTSLDRNVSRFFADRQPGNGQFSRFDINVSDVLFFSEALWGHSNFAESEVGVMGDVLAAKIAKHYGPGPHKNGTPQSVHGGGGKSNAPPRTGKREDIEAWLQSEARRYGFVDGIAIEHKTGKYVQGWTRGTTISLSGHGGGPGSAPETQTPVGIAAHELGHLLLEDASEKYGYKTMIGAWIDEATFELGLDDTRDVRNWTYNAQTRIERQLKSSYAKKNHRELFAEAYAVGRLRENPPPLAKGAVDFIDTFLQPQSVTKHYGPGPHANGTPQSVHGSGAHGASGPQLVAETKRTGGFSVEPVSSRRPETGYMVAFEGDEERYPLARLTARLVRSYRRRKWSKLKSPTTFFGAWVDDRGSVVFDVSEQVDDLTTAKKLQAERHQDAIWDVVNMKEIK